MKIDKCPRCQGEITKVANVSAIKYHCLQCNFIIANYSRLYWYLNGKDQCKLFLNNNQEAIDLPILPFDITAEKLKTLLLFI
jgi:hypothetical protein